jgi:hypothetical protein
MTTAHFRKCDALVERERNALLFLSDFYGRDVAPHIAGIRVEFVPEIWAPGISYPVPAFAFWYERRILIAPEGERTVSLAHELVHILDYELLGLEEPMHDSWIDRGLWREMFRMGREEYEASKVGTKWDWTPAP